LTLVALAAGSTSAQNLVANPGFESGLEGWRIAHAGHDDPAASYAVAPEGPHGGEHCVTYRKREGASRNNHFDYVVKVQAKTLYTLAAWVRSDGELKPLLSVEGLDWRPVAGVKSSGAREWHRVVVTFDSAERTELRVIWYGGSKGKRYEGHPGQSWLDDVELRAPTPEEVKAYEATKRTDTSNWFAFDLRWDDVEPAPWLTPAVHDAPAGKHGFVQARDGHLYFANGQRAKFWGVCLCGRAAFPTHEQADVIAARLAKWSINIVRLHALEVQIFDPEADHTRDLDPEMLDRLDYFMAQLIEHGIYIFMDWRTAWRTRKGDALAPRWLYHWAMLDERFVDLNQNYARKLYLHTNRYTSRRIIDEPAVVVFEIVNEKDIFSVFTGRHKKHPDTVRLKRELKRRFNQWLLAKHGDRAGLAKAWTNAKGVCGVRDDEDPVKGNVEIPLPAHALGSWDRDHAALTGPARGSDALRFLYDLQTDYFLRMREFLRELGVKVPISGTNWHMNIRPNARSNAQLDFTENHGYWDHAQPWGPSRKKHTRTRNAPMVRNNPLLGEMALLDKHSRGAVAGKPFMVSEWNYDSPNEFRCEGPIEMAAYGALQDWDGILSYCYYGNWGTPWDGVESAQELGMFLGSEELYNDPCTIGQFPVASAIFLRGDVRAAKRLVHVGYSKVDTFFAQGRWWQETAHLSFLPFVHRVRHAYFDDAYQGDADVVVASGLSAQGSYSQAKRGVLYFDNPAADVYGKAMGAETFGRDLRRDPRFVVAGSNRSNRSDQRWLHALLGQTMERWGLTDESPAEFSTSIEPCLASDTGELLWNPGDGVFTINAPPAQGAVGFVGGKAIRLADVRITFRTPYCSLIVSSHDGHAIRDAKRLLITAIARSENTSQFWDNGRTVVPAQGRGRAPVLVEPVEADLTIATAVAIGKATVHPLSPTGAKREAVAAEIRDGTIRLQLGKEHRTVHYVVELEG